MKHRKITNLMVTDVAVVRPITPFKEIARTLTERRVSGLPVIDIDGRVLGVVSAADLLPKQSQHEPPGPVARLTRLRRWRARAKARATVARDLMTTPAITIDREASATHAARLMDQHGITRLPVVDGDGRLVGIVGRGDLVRVMLRPDTEIAEEIVHEIFERELGMTVTPATVSVRVRAGVVALSGELEYRSQVPAAVALARRVDGVVDVDADLTWRADDRRGRPVAPDTIEAILGVRQNIR